MNGFGLRTKPSRRKQPRLGERHSFPCGRLLYRRLVESDIPAIARIHRRACLIAYAFMHWSYSETECRLWYESKFKGWDWGLIAEDGGTPIGFIAVMAAHIDQLFVDPDYQSHGIGSYLLKEALGRAPAVATLNVFEQNALARAFYEKHGFREVRRFLNEQERSIELVYGRTLRPDCGAAIRGQAAPAGLRHPRAAPS